MPAIVANSATATLAATAVIIGADLTGWSALNHNAAAILASTIGALSGTVLSPMMKKRPILSVREIIGYILAGWVVIYITHDLTPPQFAILTQLPNAEEFWSQSIALRYTVLTFGITQIPSIPLFRRHKKNPQN